MKKTVILLLCVAVIMAFAALAVFADEEIPTVQGFAYAEDKTVFSYYNKDAAAVSVKVYNTLEDAEAVTTVPMTAGENGVWTATVAGDQQQKYYTFAYTLGEESFEIPDPTNNADALARSYIPALVKYDLWVAGIQVHSYNAADILGAADEGASVSYDAATNTLTFAANARILTENPGISHTGTQTLTIQLLGDVSVVGTGGAISSASPVVVTSRLPAMFYAMADQTGAGIQLGENATLQLEGMAMLHAAGGAEHTAISLAAGAKVQLGEKNILIATGSGAAADLQATDEAYTIPMEWITTGKFVPMTSRPGVKVTIGDDPTPYTYAGWTGEQSGIAINAETPDHSYWLTVGTWQTGYGYVAYTKTETTRQAVLCNAKITNAQGPAVSFAEQTDIILQGKNILTGSTTGLSVTNATLSGYHGKLVSNGIQISEALIVKEGALELEADGPLFGDILPDLSQYSGEYTLEVKTEKPAPPQPETPAPETPEGGEPETPEGGEPETPEGGEPETPEGGEPETPEGGEPENPETPPEGGEPVAPVTEENTQTPPEGTETPPEGTETPPEGTETPPEGTETPPEGTDTPPEGTETPPAEEQKPYLIYILTPVQTHATGAWVEGSTPHCMADGVAGHKLCSVCQVYLDAEGVQIPSAYLPVNYNSHEYTYSPLDEKDLHLATCTRNASHVYTLPCFGGAEICLERRVCDGCGQKHGDRLFHIFGTNYTETDEIGHWAMCQRPGCTQADEPKAHSGGFVSCNDPYICEVCGHEYGGIAGHSYTTKASDRLISEATCGQRAVYLAQCDHCDMISEDVGVFAGETLPHTFEEAWTTNRSGHWHLCTGCGGISTPERHTEVVVGQVKATEETTGYTGDIYCSVCNVLVVQGTQTPKLTKESLLDPMVFVAIGALALSGVGFGVIVFAGASKKKKTAP